MAFPQKIGPIVITTNLNIYINRYIYINIYKFTSQTFLETILAFVLYCVR